MKFSAKIPTGKKPHETRTVKVWADSYRRAKIMAAKRGITFVALFDKLTRDGERLDKISRDD